LEPTRDLIVVTGATGKQGGAVARHLLGAGLRVRAVTRKPEGEPARKLAAAGAQVVKADFDDPVSLERALDGAWGIFAVQNTWEAGVEREEQQGKRVADLARKQGIQHYVYTSVGSAHRKTGIPHFENKWRVEETVRALKFPSHVILRPVFFMENFLGPSFGLPEGKLMMGLAPTTRLQLIAVNDIGRFGLLAFTRHAELAGQEIDIAGDALTIPEVAKIVAEVLERPIEFVRQPMEQVRAFSAETATMLEWFDRVGYNVDIPALEQRFGLQMTRFREWAQAHRAALAQAASTAQR
jgi:uncharacterized protein YbjT (DUF2867 family)